MKDKKLKKKLYVLTLLIAVYVISLSVGYAFFNKSLYIHGVASTIDYYEGDKLPNNPVKLDLNRNLYFTSDYDTGYTYATNTFGFSNAVQSEDWDDDTYTLTFDKSMLGAFQNKTINFNVSFSNPTVLDYTDGTVETTFGNYYQNKTVSTVKGTSSDVVSATSTITATNLLPEQAVVTTITVNMGTINLDMDTYIKTKVSYKLYDGDNGIRSFNIIIRFNPISNIVSLFDESSFLTSYYKAQVTKVNNGYELVAYPFTLLEDKNDKIIVDLKQNLEAGSTYRLISDYEGTIRGSAGMIGIRDANTNLVLSPDSTGIRYIDFTLTQEQIDSIDRIQIYGAGAGYESSLFTFIKLYKLK